MNVSTREHFTVADAIELYGTDRWGGGYFTILKNGNLGILPEGEAGGVIEIPKIMEQVRARNLSTPVLLRFPQILQSQLRKLVSAFDSARQEFGYEGQYVPVYPIKVNQSRATVEGLLQTSGTNNHAGQPSLGLEVGSRPELLLALSLDAQPGSLVLCNGFKDESYLDLAAEGQTFDRRTIVVIEKPFELDAILRRVERGQSIPDLGVRLRLHARGSGRWEKSGGFASKFGLSTLQLLNAVQSLEKAGIVDRLKLLHFHVGSQITEIRRIKKAVLEASRIYAKLLKLGITVDFVDVGGGLGIDYDGSNTSSDASVNYGVQEYANDVIFGIKEVCEQEQVKVPHVISESGRMLVGYHSMLVTDIRGRVSHALDKSPLNFSESEARVIQDFMDIHQHISVKNYREFYHDALAYREQAIQQFNMGMIGIEDRAKGEYLFWSIAQKAVKFSKSAKYISDEFILLEEKLREKYICNLSVFQTLPDHWALDQLFPILPAQRLNERPTVNVSLADITCDSDGEVELFIDLRKIKKWLEVHELVDGEPYDLAFAMIGAYQDTMGDLHNLFGRVNEVSITVDSDHDVEIKDLRAGETAKEAIEAFGYNTEKLAMESISRLQKKSANPGAHQSSSEELEALFNSQLSSYTYLSET